LGTTFGCAKLATSTTGLASPDVFYLGNAIGESGDNPANARVNASDQVAVRNNPRGIVDPVSILSPLYFDRDGLVGPADEGALSISCGPPPVPADASQRRTETEYDLGRIAAHAPFEAKDA